MRDGRRSFGERLAHAAARLDQRAGLVGVALLAVVAMITYASIIAINGVPFSDPYRVRVALPDDAPLMKDGDDVRIAGQLAGAVRGVDVDRQGHAVARLAIDREHAPLGRDARATVRLRGLAGAVYIAIEPGDAQDPLPEDATLARARSATGVQLTQVLDTFDPATRGALARTLRSYGNGFLGRGEHVNRAIADLPVLLPDLRDAARAASPRDGDLAAVLGSLRDTTAGFATPGGTELAALLPAAATAFTTLAASGERVRGAIAGVAPLAATAGDVLPVADATLRDAADAVGRLTPAVTALDRALPALRRLTGERQGLAALQRLAREADPVLRAARPLLAELRDPAGMLEPLSAALGPLSSFMAAYRSDIAEGAHAFTTWGDFSYPFGNAVGSRAVRFTPIFTCARARNAYPAPGAAIKERKPCGQ